jgi:hypothetical protein
MSWLSQYHRSICGQMERLRVEVDRLRGMIVDMYDCSTPSRGWAKDIEQIVAESR